MTRSHTFTSDSRSLPRSARSALASQLVESHASGTTEDFNRPRHLNAIVLAEPPPGRQAASSPNAALAKAAPGCTGGPSLERKASHQRRERLPASARRDRPRPNHPRRPPRPRRHPLPEKTAPAPPVRQQRSRSRARRQPPSTWASGRHSATRFCAPPTARPGGQPASAAHP